MPKIPKIIHLCWLSGDPYPKLIEKCIASWQEIMPDYQIILWDAAKFKNETSNRFANEAFDQRKWAFVADYIRLYALYTYGGIYLDSDVRVYKRFDSFLEHGFFSCIEYFEPTGYVAIEAAILGAQKGNRFVKECLDLYNNSSFIQHDGTFDQTPITLKIAQLAARNWNFKYIPEEQVLGDGIHIYNQVTFTNPSGEFSSTKTYAVHLCTGSWIDSKPDFFQRLIGFCCRYYNKPGTAVRNIYKKMKFILHR